MTPRELINCLDDALGNMSTNHGRALVRLLNNHDWEWIPNDDDAYEVYEILDDDRDTRWCASDDDANYLWNVMGGRMQLEFEELVTKKKRSRVGNARLIPFPDKRSPTPAA